MGSSNIQELLSDNYGSWNITSSSKGGTATFNPAIGAFVIFVAPGLGWPDKVTGLQTVANIGGYGHGSTECIFYIATSTSASIKQTSNSIAEGFTVHWSNPK